VSEQANPVDIADIAASGGGEAVGTAAARFYERRPDGALVPLVVPREVIERAHAYLWLEASGLTAEAISLIWGSAPWERIG